MLIPIKASYTGTVSPNGTFDQGGNVWEWNEAIIPTPFRGIRGGSFLTNLPDNRAASSRSDNGPKSGDTTVGFRVAMIPEPSTAILLASGLLALAAARDRRNTESRRRHQRTYSVSTPVATL